MKTLLCCLTLDIIKLLSIDFIFVITGNTFLCLPYIIVNWFTVRSFLIYTMSNIILDVDYLFPIRNAQNEKNSM